MSDPETDLRRMAFEEKAAERAHEIRVRELEIEALKARATQGAASGDLRGKLGVAGISAVAAVVGALASLGAAAVTGLFSLQETALQQDATATLEQQKFSFELIQSALTAPDQGEQVRRLQFFARIGLLPTVDVAELKSLADAAEAYVNSGGNEGRALPDYSPPEAAQIAAIQRALGQSARCPLRLAPDGVPGPATLACLRNLLPEASDADLTRLLARSPDRLMAWIAAGEVPADWRDALAPPAPAPAPPAPAARAPGKPQPLDLSPRAPLIPPG